MKAAMQQHLRSLADAEAVLQERFAAPATCAGGDPQTGDERARTIAGALAAGRRTGKIDPVCAGESALVEMLLAAAAGSPPTASAADVRRDLPADDASMERWVVRTGGRHRVFDCLLAAEGAGSSDARTRDYVRQVAEWHPDPQVRADARRALQAD